MLDLFVRIANDLAEGVENEASWRTETEFAFLSLLEFATLQTGVKPMQLGFTHGAFEAKQQAIIILNGIINTFFINDEGIAQSADLDQAKPVTAGTSETGNLEAENSASVTQTYFRD